MSKGVTRASQLAQIHIAKKDLGLDDETYRLFLKEHTNKTSAADLSLHDRFKVLKAFEDKGWKPKKRKTAQKKHSYKEPQSRYMIARWNELFEAGKVRSSTNRSFEAWIAREMNQRGQDLPRSINPDRLSALQRNQLTEKLKNWVERE